MKVAVIDKQPNNTKYDKYFSFEFDNFHLSSKKVKKLLKKDVDLDFDSSLYDIVVLIGSEATKFIAGIGSVTEYAGHLVEDKFVPMINPAMLTFKPDAKPSFQQAVDKLHNYIEGVKPPTVTGNFEGIEEEERAIEYLEGILADTSIKFVACDTETTALYPRDGYVLGISLTHEDKQGVYISTECIGEYTEKLLQDLFSSRLIVFHNAKFDLKMLEYHFGFKFPRVSDTMLMHYVLDETQGK